MPKEYEKMRESLKKRGVPHDKAQEMAAKMYSKRHGKMPMDDESEEHERKEDIREKAKRIMKKRGY